MIYHLEHQVVHKSPCFWVWFWTGKSAYEKSGKSMECFWKLLLRTLKVFFVSQGMNYSLKSSEHRKLAVLKTFSHKKGLILTFQKIFVFLQIFLQFFFFKAIQFGGNIMTICCFMPKKAFHWPLSCFWLSFSSCYIRYNHPKLRFVISIKSRS